MADFKARYEECGHALLKIYVGLPLEHLVAGFEKIQWKVSGPAMVHAPRACARHVIRL
jgi:hypothetical protein